jgi:hypothetical protein
LHLGRNYNQDISSLAGSFPPKEVASLPNLNSLCLGYHFNQNTSNLKEFILLSGINKIEHNNKKMEDMYNDYIKNLKNKL